MWTSIWGWMCGDLGWGMYNTLQPGVWDKYSHWVPNSRQDDFISLNFWNKWLLTFSTSIYIYLLGLTVINWKGGFAELIKSYSLNAGVN